MKKRMLFMLLAVGLVFGGIFGWQAFTAQMMRKYMATMGRPPAVVSTITAAVSTWQPQVKGVGSVRAVRGVDITSEVSGVVETISFTSGQEVAQGQTLVRLNDSVDRAALRQMVIDAELNRTGFERDMKQFESQAISQAALDASSAAFKRSVAQVRGQAAVVAKKTIRAPFAGVLGISSINRGQYLNPGEKIVTLQALDEVYVDFFLPQQTVSRISAGQSAVVTVDAYPNETFAATITAINPQVETESRNVQVEAVVRNQSHKLLPGMFVSIEVVSGTAQEYLTLPQSAVVFNPYGETVYVISESGKDDKGKPKLTAVQTFVTVGETRGDQIAVTQGLKSGDIVVTSGHHKIKNGSPVVIDNRVQPLNEADPKPIDE